MNKNELIKKIIQKKEYSQLPNKDVELVFSYFEKRQVCDEEKIRLNREMLHKVFTSFVSNKLLSLKNKSFEWILRKHLSTRERLPSYEELYKKLLKDYKEASVIDLGCGINGFSYNYFHKKINYLGIEAVGQLVKLANYYFDTLPSRSRGKGMSKNNLNGKVIHESLFNIEKIKKIINKTKKPRIIFLFKVLDSLEMIQGDYSKKLLKEIVPLVDTPSGHNQWSREPSIEGENLSRGKVVVSFATRSMIKKIKFRVKRNWIINFIKDNFEILDDFELGGERYISFRNIPLKPKE